MTEPYIPPWACRQWGQYEHDWLDCPDCCAAYENYYEVHGRMRDLNMADKLPYNDKLIPASQVGMEETIASIIFDATMAGSETLSQDSCNQLGKDILYAVLREFRPDLFDDAPKTYRSSASNPNFTNIRKNETDLPVRPVFEPKETVLIEVDQPKELGGPVAMAVSKDEPRKAPTFQFKTDDGRDGVCHIFPRAQNKVHLQVTDRDGTEDAMVLSRETFKAINTFVMGFDPGAKEGDKTVAMFCLPGDIQLPVTHVTALCTHLERLANEIKAAPHSDCTLSILGRKIRGQANLVDRDRGCTSYWVTGNEAPFSDPLDAILWAFRRPLDPRFYLTSAEEDSLRRLLPNGCTTHTLVVPDSQGKGGKKIVAGVGKLLHLVVHEEWLYVEEVEGKKD